MSNAVEQWPAMPPTSNIQQPVSWLYDGWDELEDIFGPFGARSTSAGTAYSASTALDTPSDSDASSPGPALGCCIDDCVALPETVEALRLHRAEVHRRSHHCLVPQCHQSFADKRTLLRHASAHSERRKSFRPHAGCPASRRGFKRRDDLLKHMKRKKHGDATTEYERGERSDGPR